MKTIEVKFNGKDYKIRANMYTLHLFRQQFANKPNPTEAESLIMFAYAALKGYNKSFNEEYEDVFRMIDDEENLGLIDAVKEILDDLNSGKDEEDGSEEEEKKE